MFRFFMHPNNKREAAAIEYGLIAAGIVLLIIGVADAIAWSG